MVLDLCGDYLLNLGCLWELCGQTLISLLVQFISSSFYYKLVQCTSSVFPCFLHIFLKINVDFIDQCLRFSSSIKTTFICASIFGIKNYPCVCFFTTASAPSNVGLYFFLESLIFMYQLTVDDLIVLCQLDHFLYIFIGSIYFFFILLILSVVLQW